MKYLLIILILVGCSKVQECVEVRYETTFYDSNWNILSKDTSLKLGGITCEPGYYLNLDTVCGSFTTGRWVIVKAFNRVLE
jgi:hypothetical protein